MILYVKVKPNQRFDRLERIGKDSNYGVSLQVRLKAAAIDGKANEHLIEYLSEVLGISKSKISLKRGQTSRIKCLEIDLDVEALNRKLNEIIGTDIEL